MTSREAVNVQASKDQGRGGEKRDNKDREGVDVWMADERWSYAEGGHSEVEFW